MQVCMHCMHCMHAEQSFPDVVVDYCTYVRISKLEHFVCFELPPQFHHFRVWIFCFVAEFIPWIELYIWNECVRYSKVKRRPSFHFIRVSKTRFERRLPPFRHLFDNNQIFSTYQQMKPLAVFLFKA